MKSHAHACAAKSPADAPCAISTQHYTPVRWVTVGAPAPFANGGGGGAPLPLHHQLFPGQTPSILVATQFWEDLGSQHFEAGLGLAGWLSKVIFRASFFPTPSAQSLLVEQEEGRGSENGSLDPQSPGCLLGKGLGEGGCTSRKRGPASGLLTCNVCCGLGLGKGATTTSCMEGRKRKMGFLPSQGGDRLSSFSRTCPRVLEKNFTVLLVSRQQEGAAL